MNMNSVVDFTRTMLTLGAVAANVTLAGCDTRSEALPKSVVQAFRAGVQRGRSRRRRGVVR